MTRHDTDQAFMPTRFRLTTELTTQIMPQKYTPSTKMALGGLDKENVSYNAGKTEEKGQGQEVSELWVLSKNAYFRMQLIMIVLASARSNNVFVNLVVVKSCLLCGSTKDCKEDIGNPGDHLSESCWIENETLTMLMTKK